MNIWDSVYISIHCDAFIACYSSDRRAIWALSYIYSRWLYNNMYKSMKPTTQVTTVTFKGICYSDPLLLIYSYFYGMTVTQLDPLLLNAKC